MKKMRILLGLMAAALILSACGGGRTAGVGGTDTTGPIRVNFVAENRSFTYNHATPLVMPDGTVVRAGDLKPFWQWVERRLGIQLQCVTSQATAGAIIQTEAPTGFVSANIFGGNAISEHLMNFGTQGRFIDLNPFINPRDMPNLYEFLRMYPAVRQTMTAYDGGIYFIPYVAEIGYFARVLLGRQSWVRILLDGEIALENETATLNVAYSGYWVGANARHASNVVVLQNNAAANGVLNFTTARNVLIDYIRATYPHLQRPSDLFMGAGAMYDIDELVALWRVVRLAPNTLSRAVTGSVVPNAEIVPFFLRLATHRECFLRLVNYFGGQRVFGSNSYGSNFFLDRDGELQFSYNQDKFLFEILPHLRDIFTEGLVNPDFANDGVRTNFRTVFFGGDRREGNNQFGFMTFDFIPSTTNIQLGDGVPQRDVGGFLPPVTRFPGVSNDFVHFVENTRTVMRDGWAISSITGGEKLMDIIRLFDFMFSPEGCDAQNFGMPEMIDPTPFMNPAGVAFPKMNSWFNEQAAAFTNGDGALFSRSFVGFNFPIGYRKSIGFEQQFTSAYGEQTWALYAATNILQPTYYSDNPLLTLIPPAFSFNSRLQRQLEMTNIGATQTDMIFSFVTTGSPSPQEIRESFVNGRVDDFVRVHREAFAMMSGR
ncbi:MAG: hypothetical protein FWB99_00540 [Treponema sp.]|nr:hypothetical protein [Treponema sp.]